MARKSRAQASSSSTAAYSSVVAPAPPSSGTRSKRKASSFSSSASSVSLSVAAASTLALGAAGSTIATAYPSSSTPTASAGSSAISPALKKRRTARAHVSAIPFPALYGSKEVINLYDDADDDEEQGTYRVVDVAASAPSSSSGTESDYECTLPVRIVNPDFHVPAEYAGRARVLHQRGEYFDAMLTRACVYQHANEYVLLQVLEVDAREFFVWSRSGVVGATGETVMEGPWHEARDAIDKFRALFLSKTLHHWDERHAQRYSEASFTWIETHQTMHDDDEAAARAAEAEAAAAAATAASNQRKRRAAKKSRARAPRKAKPPQPVTELRVARAAMPSETSTPPSRLDPDVQTFLSMVIDAASAYSSADHRFYAYATSKQPKKTKAAAVADDSVLVPIPLGKLSKTTIEKGFEALHRLHDALQCNADRTALTILSSQFFTFVPHPQVATIDSMVRLTEKVEMLVALSVHGGHEDLLLPELTRRYFTTNHLDACYQSLDCRLFPLQPTSREYGLVQAYMFNSFCCVGNNYGAEGKLVTVFRVEKPSESSRFNAYRMAPNRRVLWHGSRMSNWMGIIKHGLLITPAGVPLNGSSLGAGLYFTDKISKAMAYSHASHDRQVFLLSEVALGTCKPSTTGARAAASTTSVHHSCHGVGRCVPDSTGDYVDAFGAVWPLGKATQTKDARATHGHNEFVVYNTAQARMRYIVVTRPLY